MRQSCLLLLSLGVLMAFGDTQPDPAQALANKSVELAKQELRKISELVQAGAVARVRLEQAQLDLADAEDDAVLQRTLYGEFPVQNLSDQMADEMVAAAQRRLERQQARIQQARSLVDQGVTAQSSLTPLQEELGLRQMSLHLAHSRARLIGELAAMARYEESMKAIQNATHIEYRDYFTRGMEHYEGSGGFLESKDLKPLAIAFQKKFDHPLPISADGGTSLHRALGLDHSGRVDLAINPGDQEGIWVRRYLKSRRIPYYAFTRAMPGKATAAHIHIGPGSTRLHSAD